MDAFIPFVAPSGATIVQTKTGLGTTFGADIDVTLDNDPTPGGLLVLCVIIDCDGPVTYTLNNGPWTTVGTVFSGNGTNWPNRMYYRTSTGAARQTHVASTAAVDTGTLKVFVIELAGVDTLDEISDTQTNTSTTTATLTPTASRVATLISATGRRSTGTNVLTPAAGMTEIAEIGASPYAVNYRLIATTSGGYTVGSTGASINSSMIAAAFVADAASGLIWLPAPDTVDDEDATSDTVDAVSLAAASGAFWRADLGSAQSIGHIDALLGFENVGAVTVLVQGGDASDWSDAATVVSIEYDATGGFADDLLSLTWDDTEFRYWRLVLDTTAQDVEVFEIAFAVGGAEEPAPVEPSRAILEIYVHDEDASRWGVATWATGPATGTEGIWSAAGWQDVTPQGVNAHILWGARSPKGILTEQNAASWNVETYDPDRILDPGNADSPYYPQIVAGVPIRISHDSTVIRTGYVDRIGYKYKPPNYRGQLLCTDTLALLNQAIVPADSILSNTLLGRISDAINAAGIAVGGIPIPPAGPTGPTIADWVEGDALDDPTTVLRHVQIATQEALWVAYVQADAGLGLRSWGAPLDRGREIAAPNLEDLESSSSEEGLYSVVRVQVEDPDLDPIEREAAPLPRYGRRILERSEPTVDPEGWADAVLAERSWPGTQYVPGTIHCFTAADVDYFGSLEIMERVTITHPGVVSVQGRILGGELWVEHRKQAAQGATWQFQFVVATDGSTAIGLTTLVADGTGDTLIDDATETDYLEAD